MLTLSFSPIRLSLLFVFVSKSYLAFGLSCPMGYRQDVFGCVRAIDGKGRFPLCDKSIAFYRSYVLPCEGDPLKFPNCGTLWSHFMSAGGCEPVASAPESNSNKDAPSERKTDCGFGEECPETDSVSSPPSTKPTNVGGGGSSSNRKPKTTTGKTDSSSKGGTSDKDSESDDSSSGSAQKGKNKKQAGEESYTGQSTSCWTEDIGQVAGQPMCDAQGSPSCWTKSSQKDSGLPKCGADGKPVASANEGNGGDQATGGAGDLPQGFPQPPEVEGDRALCEQAHKKAFTCCTDPVKCVSGLDGPSSSSMTAMGTLLVGATGMIAMGGASGGDSAGIAKSCEFMKIVALGGAGANTALGGKCFTDKGSCEDKCTEVVNKYRRVLTECSNLDTIWSANGGKGPRCPSTWVSDYRAAQANAEGRGTRCTGYNANVSAMGAQAAQSAAASSFADLCQQAATNQVTGFPNVDQQPVFNGDCNDPVNASNPICVNCRGPNAQSDPLCSGLGGGSASTGSSSGSGSSFQNTGFGTRAVDGSDLSVPDTNAQSQAPIFGEGLGEEARANAIPNNGGGFAGGGGGGSMPYSGGGGGYGGPGYDTDILKGVSGGGGYSASPLGAESREGYSSFSGVLE
ncbi:MAG: hypothetical protein IPJ71_18295, partial [Bdellovibrionales bacterium]|nr:hypothetical protein [Bdellovibrionales bacterium]